MTREEVARIIDPEAWAIADRYAAYVARNTMPRHYAREASLAKADAILALDRGGVVEAAVALEMAARWFRDYEASHKTKGTDEGDRKARLNGNRAAHLEAVLTALQGSAALSPGDCAIQARQLAFDREAMTAIAAHLRENPASPYSGRQCEEFVLDARDRLYPAPPAEGEDHP